MRYERIFWLDDAPVFLPPMLKIRESRYDGGPAELLDRCTFAYTFAMGQEILTAHDFPLHILDADFPDAMSESRRAQVAAYLQAVRDGREEDLRMPNCTIAAARLEGPRRDHGLDIAVGSNCGRFFVDNLRGRQGRTVVCSSSSVAPKMAFHLDLPFYSKGPSDRAVDEVVRGYNGSVFDVDLGVQPVPIAQEEFERRLATWEHGSIEDLIGKYLG